MTIYAKAPASVPVPYLTPGKEYPAKRGDRAGFWIVSDNRRKIYCLWEGCAHLDGGNWERKEA